MHTVKKIHTVTRSEGARKEEVQTQGDGDDFLSTRDYPRQAIGCLKYLEVQISNMLKGNRRTSPRLQINLQKSDRQYVRRKDHVRISTIPSIFPDACAKRFPNLTETLWTATNSHTQRTPCETALRTHRIRDLTTRRI